MNLRNSAWKFGSSLHLDKAVDDFEGDLVLTAAHVIADASGA